MAEKQPTIRQLYQIAELRKPPAEPTRVPEFMQLTVAPGQPVIPGADLDFRDEIMAHIYDPGDPNLKHKLALRYLNLGILLARDRVYDDADLEYGRAAGLQFQVLRNGRLVEASWRREMPGRGTRVGKRFCRHH